MAVLHGAKMCVLNLYCSEMTKQNNTGSLMRMRTHPKDTVRGVLHLPDWVLPVSDGFSIVPFPGNWPLLTIGMLHTQLCQGGRCLRCAAPDLTGDPLLVGGGEPGSPRRADIPHPSGGLGSSCSSCGE